MSADLEKRLLEWITVPKTGQWPTRSMDDDLREAAAELARQRSENEALTEKAAALSEDCAGLQRRASELEAKLAEAGRDAERYRFLRDECHTEWRIGNKAAVLPGSMVDASIDAAIAAERKESGNG